MTMPANTKINQKLCLINKYMQYLSYTDRGIESESESESDANLDVLNGWDNPNGSIPPHLSGSHWWNYRAGQMARRLRNKDKITVITALKDNGELFSTSYTGSVSHKRVVAICEKAGALRDITATHIDRATGKERTRNIGY